MCLKNDLLNHLKLLGFDTENGNKVDLNDKKKYKEIQLNSALEFRENNKSIIENLKKIASPYIRNGFEIDPSKIDLELIQVQPSSIYERLYKFWNYVWWSIPYQKAFGRQMRFMLWDKYHESPFGLIGLQSPILKMNPRDKYLSLDTKNIDYWINKSMNAQRLGALPPYNMLLGGKMTAFSLVSKEIRKAYYNKYVHKLTSIKKRYISPELLFITTTSAFGRSSIYNRLKYKELLVAKSLGYTKGYGSFHISEELFQRIILFLEQNGVDTSRKYGDGPSKKIKLLGKAFQMLGLSDMSKHGLKREVFIFETCKNLKEVIHNGESPNYYNINFKDFAEWWKEYKCIPRSQRINKWRNFDKKYFLDNLYTENMQL